MVSDNFKACLKESELKEGQMKGVRVSGKSILLVRQGGQIFGVSNSCPHMGCLLGGGILSEFIVMCPCHGWKFDVRNGNYVENDAITLESYRCKIENGKVYVEIKDGNFLSHLGL